MMGGRAPTAGGGRARSTAEGRREGGGYTGT